jgi:hypothetical protein
VGGGNTVRALPSGQAARGWGAGAGQATRLAERAFLLALLTSSQEEGKIRPLHGAWHAARQNSEV